jgi:IS30 family transposase
MDNRNYTTIGVERKKGRHLGLEERGAIQALAKQGPGVRAIARNVGCAPFMISYELRRGTPPRKSNTEKGT